MLASPAWKLPTGGLAIQTKATRHNNEQEIFKNSVLSSGSFTESLFKNYVANDDFDHLYATRVSIFSLLSFYYSALKQSVFDGLKKQTNVVLDLDEFDDGDALPSIDSYRTMLRAIAQLRPVGRPNLGLSDVGNFLAVWRVEGSQAVFEFFPQDRMKWSLVVGEKENKNVISGRTEVRKIREILATFGGEEILDGKK